MQKKHSHPQRIATSKLAFSLLVSLIVLFMFAPGLWAQTGTWTNLVNGDASGSWGTANNWDNSVIANGANNTADFSALNLTTNATVTLDGARIIGNIIFGDTTPDANWAVITGIGGPLTLDVAAGSPTLTANNGSNIIAAVVAGPKGLAKGGGGTVRLNAANPNLQELVIIDAGRLQIGNATAAGTNGNHTTNDRVINTNGGTIEIIAGLAPNNKHLTLSGAGVGGTLGALYAFPGNNSSTRWGLSSLNASGASANSSAAFPAISLDGDATIRVDGDRVAQPASTFLVGHVSGTNSTLTKTGGGRISFDRGMSGVTNLIVQAGSYSPNQGGAFGAIQAYTVAAGAAIENNQNNCFSSSANLQIQAGGFVDFYWRADVQTYSQNLGYLNGDGVVTAGSRTGAGGVTTLVLQGADSNSVFNGSVTVSNNVRFNLTKNNGATVTLNGNNSYNGLTTVNGGELALNGNNSGLGGILVNSGATLRGAGTIASAITNQSGILAAGNPAVVGSTLTVLSNIIGSFGDTIILSNANLKVDGAIGPDSQLVGVLSMTNGTLEIPLRTLGASAFVSTLTVDGNAAIKFSMATPLLGQFPIISYGSIGGLAGFSGLSLVSPPGITASLVNNVGNLTIDVLITAIPALTWEGSPAGTWNVGVANWKGSLTYTEPGGAGPFVVFDDTALGTTSVTLGGTVSPQGVTVNNTTKNYTFSGSGAISGTGGLAKQGSGSLTVANSGNDFSGGINLQQGTLQVGTGGTTGDLGSGAIANLGTLALNRSDSFTLANTVSGNGAITKAGAGTVIVPVSGDSTGALTVNGGTLQLGPVGSSKFSGDVTGSGAFGVNGAGTLIISGFNNAYAGGTVIGSGTLQFGDELGNGSIPAGNISNNGGLALSVSTTLGNNISGSGGVSVVNNQFVTLSGVNTYSGRTAVAGNLTVSSASSLPAASTLQLGNPDAGTVVGTVNFASFNPVLSGLRAGAHSAGFEVCQINLNSAPQTLTINGNVLIGVSQPNGAIVNFAVVDATASGTCTLSVVTNGGTIQLGYSASPGGTLAEHWSVDLTSLGTFHADLGATGLLSLGTLNTGNSGADATVPQQSLSLAANSNSLNMGTITIGGGEKHNSPYLRLGAGTNILNADTINLGTGGRDEGNLVFQTPGSGSVRVRGYAGGSSRASLNIGTGTQGTGGPATNRLDLLGNYADLMLGPVVIGNQPNRNGAWEQSFSFNQGVLDALSVSMSGGKSASANPGSSTLNIGGGVASLGPVSLTASAAPGNLNITGGSVSVAGIASPGTGTATFNISDATLTVNIPGFGNPASAPIAVDTFSASGTVNLGVAGTGFTVGQFPLISYAGAIGGSGFSALNLISLPPNVSASLVNNSGNQTVDLLITAAPPAGPNPTPTNIVTSVVGNQLELSWPADRTGWQLQSNAVSVVNSGAWFEVPGSTTTNRVFITIDPTQINVFYRMFNP
jgi:fibronectin-binding autotransporter adhesin